MLSNIKVCYSVQLLLLEYDNSFSVNLNLLTTIITKQPVKPFHRSCIHNTNYYYYYYYYYTCIYNAW